MAGPGAVVLVAMAAALAAGCAAEAQSRNAPAFPEERLQALVGQSARICGLVVEYSCRNDRGTQIDLESPPSQLGVSIRLPVASRPRFGLAFESKLLGRSVCAEGTISRVDRRFFVQVDEPAALVVQAGAQTPAPPDLVGPCDPDVTIPKLRREEKPQYTLAALNAGITGEVWLDTVVGVDGKTSAIRVIRSLDRKYGLDAEAVKALQRWIFAPGQYRGQPAPVRIVVELRFTTK